MPNYLKKESGYSLLVVLMIMTMFSIIGLALMGMTVNSMKLVKVNSDTIVNKTSAEMGLDEAMDLINQTMNQINSDVQNKKITFNTLNDLKVYIQGKLNGMTAQNYEVTHSTIRNGDDGVYIEKVTIEAQMGQSGKKIRKTITISTIANVFTYSAVTPGILKLNGAPYIQGDVSAKNIEVSNTGKFIDNGTRYVPTSYPAIKGNLTVLPGGTFKRFNEGTSYGVFDPTPLNLQKYFSVPPSLKASKIEVDDIPVSTLIDNKKGSLSAPSTSSGDKTYSTTKTFSGNNKFGNLTINGSGDLYITGNLVVTGNLVMSAGTKLKVDGSIRVSGTANISGTLTLTKDGTYVYIEGTTTIKSLNLNGPMYINNTLNISADLNTNAAVYAKGRATIQNLSNNSGGTLVLLSASDIQISNIYDETGIYDIPKEINAFFYSKGNLEIYGILSNLKINGGIYGNNITLNAVKGKSSKDDSFVNSFPVAYDGTSYVCGGSWWNPTYCTKYDNYYFENNQNVIDSNTDLYDPIKSIGATKSRLSVIYQGGLILNPPKGIPTASEQKIIVTDIDTVYD
jgi:Tfp pilus assembly protein PilX